MSSPSTPVPRSSRARKALAIGGLALLLLGAIGVVGVATYPRWAGGFVERAIIERVEARLGGTLTIGELSLDYENAVLRETTYALSDGSRATIDEVQVALVPGEIWSGRIAVDTVTLRGGRIEGEVDDFIALARRAKSEGAGTGRGDGRVRIKPRSIAVAGVSFALTHRADRDLAVDGAVDATIDVGARSVQFNARDTTITRGERSLTLGQLSTTIAVGGDDLAGAFPLTLAIDAAGTAITPEIAVSGVHGSVSILDQQLSEIAVDLAGGFSDLVRPAQGEADLWSLKGKVRRDLSEGDIRLTMAAFELMRVPQVLDRLPLIDSERATVGGGVEIHFADGKGDIAGDLTVKGLNVDHPMLASTVVRDVGFAVGLEASVDPAASSISVKKASLRRDSVVVEISGEVAHPPEIEGRHYDVKVSMPPVRCQEVLQAIPAELAPSLQGFVLTGDFEMSAEAKINLADLEHLSLTGKVGIDKCVVKSAPPRVAATRLQSPFTHRAVMRDGREVVVELHAKSGAYTPLAEISPWMSVGVLTTEDGGFWRHKGFLPAQFETALRRNLEAGRIRLGASTISMQMVKNVLLSHERTFARKFQELFLTWYVERSLSKERIMEIYLNVIEFGPGIYGVTRAAAHYFGKKPADLTPPEAAYLALMLPSPVRRHANYCDGELSSSFKVKVRRIVSLMNSRGRMDDETYALWKDGEITFDRAEFKSKNECLGEIKRLLAASEKQRSRSGLLDDGAHAAPEDTASELFDAILDDTDAAAADAPGTPAMDYDFLDGAP